jgi:Holliday junction DNA helicase RuvB
MKRFISHLRDEEDVSLDTTLRPRTFDEFVGQRQTTGNLKIYIEAARQRNEPLDHILFSGLPGLGKTTLATLVANELKAEFKTTSGPALEKPADLVGILTNLKKSDILFIDEIHRIPTTVEEYLYSALEDFLINIIIDQGPHARSLKLTLPHFTLIGATTREGLLTEAFRARFGIFAKLDFYPAKDLFQIIKRSAKLLGVELHEAAGQMIASRARGTPRIANRLLKRIRDLAQLKSHNVITEEIARQGLEMLGIDEAGLDATDRKILTTIRTYSGNPVGIKTIAISVGEEEDTIEEVYEPYLIQQGLLEKTPRGRRITSLAQQHLNKTASSSQPKELF